MIIDGIELLEKVKNNEFEDGDEIIAQITKDPIYVYSAYHRNFINKKTNIHLKVQDYVFWTFDIKEQNKEINIQAIGELNDTNFKMIEMTDEEINYYQNITRSTLNEVIKAVKQLDKKMEGE